MGLIGRHIERELKVKKGSGNTFTVAREHYLRDDLGCHSSHCATCPQDSIRLPASSHYLIPDADSILDLLEILELPQLSGVIYAASVVQEVHKKATQRTSNRLRTLYNDPRRQNLYFDDQHRADVWLTIKDRLESYDSTKSVSKSSTGFKLENKLQMQQRDPLWIAIQVVAEWFAWHLGGKVEIVVLTRSKFGGDEELDSLLGMETLSLETPTMQTGLPDSVKILNSWQYFQRYWGQDRDLVALYDSLLQTGEDSVTDRSFGRKSTLVYKEHVAAHVVEEGLRAGSIRVGVFSVSTQIANECYVRSSNSGGVSLEDVFVPDRSLQNRAIYGDIVAIQILTRSQRVTAGQPTEPPETKQDLSDLGEGKEENLAGDSVVVTEDDERWDSREGAGNRNKEGKEESNGRSVLVGEVVRIVQRAQRDYVACLHLEDENRIAEKDSARQEALMCVPMDRRIPLVRVKTRQAKQLTGQRFLVRIDGWERSSVVPHGHVLRILGPIGDLNAEGASILVSNSIIDTPFSNGALSELPTDLPWTVAEDEVQLRRDLRDAWFTCSIDPPGSKDVDDALSVQVQSNGLIEVGVHIADVSHFVRSGSLLDLEARSRGTTVYLVDRRLNMLPELLSENLCSLLGGVDRLAVSVIWTVDLGRNFEVVSTWLGRTVIHSRYQMAYEQAQSILENKDLPDKWGLPGPDSSSTLKDVRHNLTLLAAFAQELRNRRKADGALELSSSEMHFQLNEKKEPVQVQSKNEILMNGVIAELMIAANASVAQYIYEAFPNAALLRRHAPPQHDGLYHLVELCKAQGLQLDMSGSKALAESLARLRGHVDKTIEAAVQVAVTRSMSEAQYFCTGLATTTAEFYHYGLALPFYTHFTSPIRRYADIVVHRTLLGALASKATSGRQDISEDVRTKVENHKGLPSTVELNELARHVNARHRASKAAQKSCNRLFLLLYLAKHPQAEAAVVKMVHRTGLVVFVPKYDLHGTVSSKDWTHPKALEDFRVLETVWVELSAEESRARGPFLKVSLLASEDPKVQDRMASAERVAESRREVDLVSKARLSLGIQDLQSRRRENGEDDTVAVTHPAAVSKAVAAGKFETMQDVIVHFVDGFGELTFVNSGYLGLNVTEDDTKARKRRHHNLARASAHRSRRMRSFLSEDSVQQTRRHLMEKQARQRARHCVAESELQ